MKKEDKNFDFQKIKSVIKQISTLMREFGLAEVKIDNGSTRIVLKREIPILGPAVSSTTQSPTGIKGSDEKLGVIKSQIPGTFYGRVSPDSKPYVEIGSEVEPQTKVCIIEAMKVMNEVTAETTGTIVEILAEDGQAVEIGTPLFKVRLK